jgi:hypothetical protein
MNSSSQQFANNITSENVDFALVNMTYYAIGCVVLSVVGFIGNGVIILSVAKNSEMREKSHWLVCLLSVADFCTCLGVFIAAFASFLHYDKNITQSSCFWIQSFAIFWSSVDNFMIFLIGIDRVIVLRHALRYGISYCSILNFQTCCVKFCNIKKFRPVNFL